MNKLASTLGLIASVLVVAGPASATLITRTYDVTVNNVQDETGNHVASPVNPVVGSFTVTFDPALGLIVNQTTGITVNNFNVPSASPIAFSYSAANTDELQIGGLDQGTNSLTEGVDDFLVDIFDASGPTPFFGNMTYTSTVGPFSSFAPPSRADGIVTVEPAMAVPEPPAVALLLGGALLFLALYAKHSGRYPFRVGAGGLTDY